MPKRPKTIKSLAEDLHGVYDQLKTKQIESKDARTISGVADKIVKCASVRLRYKALAFSGNISKMEELD